MRVACCALLPPRSWWQPPPQVGDEVAAGAPVLVLESMKMETVIPAPFAGRIKELLVIPGSQVETSAPLVKIEPIADADEAESATGPVPSDEVPPGLDLPDAVAEPDARARAKRGLADLSAIVMGFDIDPRTEGAALASYLKAREELRAAGEDVVTDEIGLVALFADLAELSRNRPAGEELKTELRVHSAREHLHTYLQSLDVERGGLPDAFRERLTRALAHYGVTSLDRGPGLEEAVFRIFLTLQRSDLHVVTALLERWLGESATRSRGRGSGRAGAPGPRHPATLPRGGRSGPQHPVPLVRPAAGRPGACRCPSRGA
ncbi:MAG: biotin/lipoyl-containing protein [Nocardioides sp.]